MKGLIALDIDGTITGREKLIPLSVTAYLKELHASGWTIGLITGRSYRFASKIINFSFPYILATQNGANIFQMPEEKKIAEHYLDNSILPILDEIYQKIPESYLVYSNYERGDICYYREYDFSKEGIAYINLLKEINSYPWKVFSTIDSLEIREFPLVKCFGNKENMLRVQQELKGKDISSSVIRDPIDPFKHLCLITSKEADKGKTVKWLQWLTQVESPVITAGNDMNDVPLLEAATIAISFEGSPLELLQHADIIVPHNNGEGIIEGLKKAITLC